MSGQMDDERIDALRHPTHEKAMKLWDYALLGEPQPDTPLAGLHKARILWHQSTEQMKEESRAWLIAHGFTLPFKYWR
jgi:hypothetical protein